MTTAIYFAQAAGLPSTILSIFLVMGLSFLLLYFSDWLVRAIGRTGIKILTRIMGLFTAAIAVGLIEKALVLYGVLHAGTIAIL